MSSPSLFVAASVEFVAASVERAAYRLFSRPGAGPSP